jgi:hypothetical protein
MKLSQNQFFGTFDELPSSLPVGSTFASIDTGQFVVYGKDGTPRVGSTLGGLQDVTDKGNGTNTYIVVDDYNPTPTRYANSALITAEKHSTEAGSNLALAIDVVREAPSANSGYSFASYSRLRSDSVHQDGGLYGNYVEVDYRGTGGVETLVYGEKIFAKYTGSGDLGDGSTDSATMGFLLGQTITTVAEGTGTSKIGIIRAISTHAELNNPNVTLGNLQGHHNTVSMMAGTVSQNAAVNLLDFDYTGGTVGGNFAYLHIQEDAGVPFDTFVGGTARAINSASPLPSLLAGTLEAKELISTTIQVFADDAAAGVGGVTKGTIYSTVAGDLKIKL